MGPKEVPWRVFWEKVRKKNKEEVLLEAGLETRQR